MAACEQKKISLPYKNVVFLGGHQNMTKKLRQQFPKWIFIGEEQLYRRTSIAPSIVFFWTKHSSHKMMQYVYSRLSKQTTIIYVSATNIKMLEDEMLLRYSKQMLKNVA